MPTVSLDSDEVAQAFRFDGALDSDMMSPRAGASLAGDWCHRRCGSVNLSGDRLGACAAQAVAGEIEAVGVVDEAVENGVGIGGIADHGVPVFDGKLAGDDGGSAPVAFLEDFEQVVTGLGIERLESPIVENEKLDAAERAGEAGIAAVAAGERQIAEQLGDALIENGAIVAAGLVAERASQPAFADAGRAADRQIVVRVDPVAGDELLEQRAIEPARSAVIDILDERLLAQPGIAQSGGELLVVPIASSPGRAAGQAIRDG